LLKYHGQEFVRSAYRAILKREPDGAGFQHHLENLASGRFNKIDILASLRYSPEGERAGVHVDGLKWPAAIRRMGRAPLVGYLLQLLIAALRLPLLLQHQRQSEFYLSSQQQRIVEHDNQVHSRLVGALAQLSAQTNIGAERGANQQQVIELLSQQQQDLTSRQVEFSDRVETRFASTRQHIDQATANLTGQFEERARALNEQIDRSTAMLTTQLDERAAALTQQFDQSRAAQTQQLEAQIQELLLRHQHLTRQVEEQAERLIHRQQQTHTELLMQERRLTLLLEKAGAPGADALAQPLVRQMANEEAHLLDALYASFEDQFRGSREEVKNRLRVYLPVLRDAEVSEDVLDIGCGRGEWLELLAAEGVSGRGVDHNRIFVEQCRHSGLDVLEEDALRYLRSLPDRSLKAITSFHTVEHFPFETLVKLLDESVRVLKPGGLLILETPNPENFMVGSCNFYTDPTHRNPIPSPTLQFLLEARGLYRTRIMKLRPWDAAKIEGDTEIIKRFNEYFYSAPDYGIIGWKG
jgi:O-antigen chain-terminating methyltransferase